MQYRTQVDFHRLLCDLFAMYPYCREEAVLVELIANALDAKASVIEMRTNPAQRKFEMIDDGRGMTEREFKDYHDIAVSPKIRGQGIGFAGLGAKLALELCHDVVTETWSDIYRGVSRWRFEGNELVWDKREGTGLRDEDKALTHRGTRTTLSLLTHSQILNAQDVADTVLRHYYPLLDPDLSRIYREGKVHPRGVRFLVNGHEVTAPSLPADAEKEVFWLRLGRRQRPAGIGYFVLAREELDEDLQGIALSTFGKVITREWFKKYPRDGSRITGIVEVPELVECLTTSKNAFIKTGSEGQKFYRYYRELQKVFGDWLLRIGKMEPVAREPREAARLESLVRDILRFVPELAAFFASRTRADVAIADQNGEAQRIAVVGAQKVHGTRGGEGEGEGVPVWPGQEPFQVPGPEDGSDVAAIVVPRTIKVGPKLAWVDAPDRAEMSWVDGDTILINSAHPAYQKAEQRGLTEYHNLTAIATSLVILKGPESPDEVFELVNKFMTGWASV